MHNMLEERVKESDIDVKYADLAHLVERDLAKVEVAGSSPVIRSKSFRRYSQVVRPRSAKPLFPGSNPGGASRKKSCSKEQDFFQLNPP